MKTTVIFVLSIGWLFIPATPSVAQDSLALRRITQIEDGDVHYFAARETSALPLYRAATYDATGKFIPDSLSALALHKIANCASYLTSIPADTTIRLYHTALAFRRKLFGRQHGDVARTLYNFGGYLKQQEQYDSASVYLFQAATQYEQLAAPDTVSWVKALNYLAQVSSIRRDRDLLESVAAQGVELLDRSSDRMSPASAATLYYNFTWCPSTLGLLELSEFNARKALRYFDQTGEHKWKPATYNALYAAAAQQKEYATARSYIDTAIQYAAGGSALRKAIYLVNRATVEIDLEDYPAALRSVRLAEEFAPPDFEFRDQLYSNRAIANYKSGTDAGILEDFDKSIQSIRPQSPLRLDSLNLSELRKITFPLVERARYRASKGESAAAIRDFELALTAHERVRDQVSGDDSRRFLSQDVRLIFDDAVSARLEAFRTTGDTLHLWTALQLSDRARAYTLGDRLRRNRQQRTLRQQALERRLGRLDAEVLNNPEKADELRQVRLELAFLGREQPPTPPRAAGMIDGERLLGYLREHGTELIQYHLARDTSYAFHLTPAGGLTVRKLPSAEALSRLVTEFRDQLLTSRFRRKSLRKPDEQAALNEVFLQKGHLLARTLVPGSENKSKGTRLLVIPDGLLNFLPFAGIPLPDSVPELDYHRTTFLGSATELQYAYSLSTLLSTPEPRRSDTDASLLMAPSFAGALHDLPYNRKETAAICPLLPHPVAWSGAEATREKFLDAAPGAGLLHLSTHGFANAEEPNLSYVAFSQSADTLDPDALLYYPEISTLPLGADLVVLSACETNLGKYVPGETALSLASAFTTAGARSTVTSLWRVDDEATAELMTYFYRHLADGEDRAAALAAAQRELRATPDYVHPYYWAAFVLTGADGPVDLSSRGSLRPAWLIVLASLAAGILANVWYRGRSRTSV